MACCILTAYIMNRIIKVCEVMDLNFIKIQYNEFDDGPILDRGPSDKGNSAYVVSKWAIEGMSCAACTAAIEGAVKAIKGVEAVSVSLSLSRASVVHDPKVATVSNITNAIKGSGYDAQAGERTAEQNIEFTEHAAELKRLRTAFTNAALLASLVVSLDSILPLLPFLARNPFINLLAPLIGSWVQLIEASWIHKKAWRNGLFSAVTMDTLISLSLIIGLTLSSFNVYLFGFGIDNLYFSSGSFLTTVVIGGRYLDTLLRKQTVASLAQLYHLQSETNLAKVRKRQPEQKNQDEEAYSSRYELAPALSLQPGDQFIIDAGSLVPCDCYVTEGTSIVDESTATGESLPATRRTGDFLMSGTRNLTAELVAIVSRGQDSSTLDQLVSSISTATEQQRGEASSDELSASFVKIILVLTFIATFRTYTMCDTALSGYERINFAGQKAMAVLASACPCALGLATPSAVMSSLSVAWSKGVIFTGGSKAIEKLQSLTHLVLDKTGTLTTGKLSVFQTAGSLDVSHYMLICAIEREEALFHPVARTVFQWALLQLNDHERSMQNTIHVTDLESQLGKGISCRARLPDRNRYHTLHIGTKSFLSDCDIQVSQPESTGQEQKIAVHFSVDHQYVATLFLQDTIRPEAGFVIKQLKSRLNLSLTMLTGDHEVEAQRVSKVLSVPVLSSRALPHEKKTFIQQIQSQGSKNCVGMVGDGLNDVAAMAAADIGILLSPGLSRSNQTQVQVADVILTTPNLERLVDAITIACKTRRQIEWNTRWAVAYNIIAVALAMGVLENYGIKLDAPMAGTMMAFSSMSVMGWSLWFRGELNKDEMEDGRETGKGNGREEEDIL